MVEELEPELVQNQNYDKESYLTTAANSIEASIIEGLLGSNEIPCLKKYREAGAYLEIYMGSSNFGVDIYVPLMSLEKAREILESKSTLVEEEPLATGDEYIGQTNRKKGQRLLTWIILLFLIPGVLWIVLAALYNLFNWIKK